MKKILIVDDNVIAREGMKTIFPWQQYDMEIVAYKENGKAAFDYLCENEVDLVICDVEMPIMNGIELLRELRSQGNSVKFIFMSCYNEFNFVKSALDMDAIGYVLKPIISEDLKDAIFKVLNIYQKEDETKKNTILIDSLIEKHRPMLIERFFRELLFGILPKDHDIQEVIKSLNINLPVKHTVQVVLIKFCSNQSTKFYDIDNMGSFSALCDMINTLNSSDLLTQSLPLDNEKLAAVFISLKDEDLNLTDIFSQIKEYCIYELGIKTVFAISSSSDSILDCSILMKESKKIIDEHFLTDNDGFIFYNDITTKEICPDIDLKEMEREINNIFLTMNIDCAQELISKYLGDTNTAGNRHYTRYIAYTIINITDMVAVSYGTKRNTIIAYNEVYKKLADFDSILNIKEFILNVYRSIFEGLQLQSNTNNTIVKKIKEIIQNEYMNHLTVSYIADKLYFSTTHISNVFKEETGMTIYDYMVNFRMETAKSMLKERDSKIYVVASKVGYKNQSHFKLLFKQYTGMSPNEYKNIHLNKKV